MKVEIGIKTLNHKDDKPFAEFLRERGHICEFSNEHDTVLANGFTSFENEKDHIELMNLHNDFLETIKED